MFEKATEIRRRYSEKADARAMEKGREEAIAHVKSELSKRGIELPPDAEEAIYGKNGHSR